MQLNSQQAATLMAYIQSVPALNAAPMNSDGAVFIADEMNKPASPAFVTWREEVTVEELHDAVKWASLTPSDAVPTSGADTIAAWSARSLACQGKQFNLQMILQRPSGVINALRPGVRTGLQDALTGVPSGVGGAPVDAGWAGAGGVRLVLQRNATVFEKLFATGAGTTVTPATITLVGPVDEETIRLVRGG